MGIYRLTVFRIISPALRWSGWALVLLYVVTMLALVAARYIIFPNIQNYTPYLEAHLSSLLDGRVELGRVSADWHRLNPRIEIRQVTLHDSRDARVLTIPHLAAVVSWRSVLTRSPQFVSVHAGGVDLSVRRDTQGQLWLMGRNVSDSDAQDDQRRDTATAGERTVRWLAAQPQIRLYGSTLRWIDESRDGRPLILQDVSLKIRNRGAVHQFSLAARPAEAVGGSFDMRGDFVRSPDRTRPLALETGQGRLYVGIDNMRPSAWTPWIDWPDFLHSDRVSMRTWFDVDQGEPLGVTTDLRVHDAQWRPSASQLIHTGQARVQASGPWQGFQAGMMDFSMQASDVTLSLPDVYDEPVVIQALGARGSTGRADSLSLQLDDFRLYNSDIALTGTLDWDPASGTPYGHVAASAQVSSARLDAVHRYMPRDISDDVRIWLEQGLLAGTVRDATIALRGDLSDFPFDDDDSNGEFNIRGTYQDAIIDYLPESDDGVGWPRLDALQGWIELDRASLHIHAETGRIQPGTNIPIQLSNVNAGIHNLMDDPVLKVSGSTQGDGATYMAFLQGSELNGMLDRAFEHTTAQGAWTLPLTLTVPLSRSRDTQVAGTIQITDGRIGIEPGFPVFEDVNGDIRFTHDDVVLDNVSARFLNGNVQLSGGVGPQRSGLSMAGQVDAHALRELFDAPGMARFEGQAAYVATLSGIGGAQAAQRPVLSITSDLKGMALNFPPPLDKGAGESWPLDVSWLHGAEPDARSLRISLNHTMHARFDRDGASSRTYFDSGSLGAGRPADPPDAGLAVDIEHPVFDGDAWDAIPREFTTSHGSSAYDAVFPDLRSLRVQTGRGQLLGLPLDQLTYTVRQHDSTQWRADISSTQTAGTLTWSQENGTIQGPVQAIFHRLAFGDDSSGDEPLDVPDDADDGNAEQGVDDELRIPAINLIIDNLRLYGRDVGRLALVGVNEDQGDTWRLEQFALSSPSAHLEGRGVWRLRGPARGLTLDAEVDVSDLGDYFDQIGFKDVLQAGEGKADMQIEWHDLPWSFDVGKIVGTLNFEFAKGRLSTMNSKSARLLELVSLQSVRRLATLDVNPLTLTKEGFPYDVLRGMLRLEHGQVYTEDYRLTGPVGTIVLDGLVHLKSGKLDLQAVVIPNLDVSGAAIAAGVAINPVVGIGAFLTQWLLKAPLAAAMTAQYEIKGDWDQPEIQAVERIKGQTDP